MEHLNLNGLKLKNRFLVSSGGLEYGRGWPWERPLIKLGLIDPSIFGAVITKTLTLQPSRGNYIDPFEFEKRRLISHFCHIFSKERKKVLRKIPGGWVNNMGWWNIGIDYWLKEIYPQLRDVAIIVNIGGFCQEDFLALIKKLNPLKIVAIELNISCPNIENAWIGTPSELVKFFSFCRETSAHPLIAKLGVVSDYLRVARIAEYCGINALSAINAIPVLGGGYSGRAIKPIALRVVFDLKRGTSLPVIGGGGIYSWKDCQQFFSAGADAVSFGSLHFFQSWKPTLLVKIHGGMRGNERKLC